MTVAAAAYRLPPPWCPPPAQADFIAAVCAPAGGTTLEDWCTRHASRPIDDGVLALLPFAFDRLLEIAPGAEVTRRAQALYLENSRLNLVRVGRLLAVLRLLGDACIPSVVLKGMALAIRYHHNFGARAMGDVDLLVRPRDRVRAVDLLARAGWTVDGALSTALIRDAVARVQHAVAFSAPPAHSLDLHWHLHQFMTPEVDDALWDAVEPIDFEGATVHVLGPTDQIFHACCHATQPAGTVSPRWMLDVHAILRAEGPRVQWSRLVSTARLTHASVRLEAALAALDGVTSTGMPLSARRALAESHPARWERGELALFERMPPFTGRDRFRWHWYGFRRLRLQDAAWCRLPVPLGFLDYVRLKRRIRSETSRRDEPPMHTG